MRKTLKRIIVIAGFALIALEPASLQSLSWGREVFLDLPNGAGRSIEEEEELPEIIIFYEFEYETNGVFFCLDQSMSMGSNKWSALQRELIEVVNDLSNSSEFGIVFFHETAEETFPRSGRPPRATDSKKQQAIRMVMNTLPSDKSTCFLEGLKKTVKMANTSRAADRCIIFMSDGKATCVGQDSATYTQRTLQEIRLLNKERVPINTVGIGFEPVEYFLKGLARESGGTYRRLPCTSAAGK
jgi:hypothetical protein